ncbi:hypothetical protein QYE76_027431 [Lolium multiflorum]|uniref:F-box domain-containing protein n=1 Tax=Lolium multiflorum TaxID=4521 RepID=A0AAD8QJ38_LOLMU|nr:hypothetical protein QYE76_027431 [Lolium multiflorum]
MVKKSRRTFRTREIHPPPRRRPSGGRQLDSGCKDVHPDAPLFADRRNWAALPRDVLWVILSLVPQADILRGAGLVCASWWRLAHDEPLFWRHIDLAAAANEGPPARWMPMAVAAVRRSAGRCESFRGRVNGNFLLFLAQRAPLLRRLHMTGRGRLDNTPGEKFMRVMARKLHQLEELVLAESLINGALLAPLIDHCPRLQLLDAGSCYTYSPIDSTLRARLEGRIKDLRLPCLAVLCR